ncbi:MAG: YbaB/EbfC family nucleoid-associated protein [Winogradskyella sp.]|uniref:YbaB/EbfC family nucleoid-associated protein n=1 Tax=Winogradskyella sp. TaxID=1883156 RepID=UPI0017C04BBA|nr:YbaB/EbfC family nucleoid-associated protein [Winogradskyella sp.]MBT8244793.1 YbaB/EbfC family nucleoid-associated protein [Winogradskyella sp.]NNK22919.1 YbaB/EbfC family nucleoid-associated protein [Winogradskyella sp.]
MFGDMMGMMNKLKEAQKKVEETKERLNDVLLDEASNDNKLKVTITANRTLKSIDINEELLTDKEMLEDYLILTLNKAIERATTVNETELAAVAKEGMPNIPGL